LGNLLWMQGKHEDAHREMKHALEILQRLAGDFPNRPAYQKKLAETYNSLGTVWASIKDHEQAEENYVQARALFERLVNEHGDVAEYVQLLGITVGNLGWLRTEEKDWAGARQPLEQAIQHLEKALKSNRKNPDCLKALRDQQQSLAETLIRIGDHAAAAAAATALADVYRDRGQDYYYAACFLSRCLPLVDRDPQLTDRLARKTCAHKYADEARAMLTKAKEVGGVSRLANEEEIFAPLMNQPAFQQILTDLGGKTKS
jgi:tetratricopeptide (TPR) repeat protein